VEKNAGAATMMQHRLVFLGIPILMVIAACTSTDSTYIDTAGMYANFEAEAVGDGTTDVRGSLRQNGVHSTSFIDLEGGDLLRAVAINPSTLSEQDKIMTEHQLFGGTWYTANFPLDDKDTEFRIEYERVEKESAMNSVASIPVSLDPLIWSPDPTVATPDDAPNPFSRASTTPYYVGWRPNDAPFFETGDELSYEVTGTCIQTFQGNIDWNVYDALQLTGAMTDAEPPNDGTCEITVKITLSRDNGYVDGAFAGGIFVGKQTRTLRLTAQQ
jgi:hypothetical protein